MISKLSLLSHKFQLKLAQVAIDNSLEGASEQLTDNKSPLTERKLITDRPVDAETAKLLDNKQWWLVAFLPNEDDESHSTLNYFENKIDESDLKKDYKTAKDWINEWGKYLDFRKKMAGKLFNQSGQLVTDPNFISKVQTALRKAGFSPGNSGPNKNGIDGFWGENSEGALFDFKYRHGLPYDGCLTQDTMQALGLK